MDAGSKSSRNTTRWMRDRLYAPGLGLSAVALKGDSKPTKAQLVRGFEKLLPIAFLTSLDGLGPILSRCSCTSGIFTPCFMPQPQSQRWPLASKCRRHPSLDAAGELSLY